MLRRIEHVEDSGIFQDFRWPNGCPDFRRINVVYGGNGSGKTSLACALDRARHDPAKRDGIKLQVEDDGGARTTSGDDAVFDRIYVFSADFVRRNHRFGEPKGPEMSAVLTVGERSAEAEDQLITLREQQGSLTGEIDELVKSVSGLDRRRSALLSRASESVVGDLTKLGGMYQSKSHYTVRKVEERLVAQRNDLKVLSTEELSAARELINAPKQDTIDGFSCHIQIRESLPSAATAALERTAATVILDTLDAHPQASKWVSEGSELHRQLGDCIFCGGQLTSERKQAIDAHFSGEVASLESEVRTLLSEVDEIRRCAGSVAVALPSKSALYADLQPGYENARDVLAAELAALDRWANVLRDQLARKLENVVAPFANTEVQAPPDVHADEVERLVGQHNQRSNDHERHVQEAAICIERHHLAQVADDLRSIDDERKELNRLSLEKQEQLGNVKSQIARLENIEGDPLPTAGVLNREVARLLGRSELSFEADGSRYRVLRNGSPAVGLGEGERTAITLIHFMETVANHDAAHGAPIVVVDDPVSSLDSSVFMGVSTYIWSEYVTKQRAAQLFVLTHNLELFRQWDIQLEGLHRSSALRREFPACLYQLSTCHRRRAGEQRRCPVLAEWPPPGVSRKKVRSAYLHAFHAIAEAKIRLDEQPSLERQLDAQLLFPNVIRRLLEGFIGFKRPELSGDFTGAMSKFGPVLEASGYDGDPDALRLRLTRFAHAYSHEENPDTTAVIDPGEIGPALASVFEFIAAIDREHFDGLCRVMDVDPAALLMSSDDADVRAPAASDDQGGSR